MEQAGALPWTELLKLDVYTLLHSAGLHEEADHVSEKLQAAFAEKSSPNQDTSSCVSSRLGHLRRKAEAYDLCFDLLQRTCSSHLESGIAPLQQKLWSRSLEVSRMFLTLHDQQQKQLESWSSRYKGLRQEHQVLRSNLRSLKLTVQQLLTDVSTLLQHTASARQQQQQQEALQQQQDAGLSSGWSKHADFQQHLQRTGFAAPSAVNATTGSSAATDNAGATHRGPQGGRRCVSADGSAPKSDAGAGADSHASLVALTMQRLIGSIVRMSRHFADCQAGKLIEDYGSGLADPAAPGAAPAAAAAAARQQRMEGASATGTGGGAGAGGDPTASIATASAAPVAAVSSNAAGASAGVHCGRTSSSCNRDSSSGTAGHKDTAVSQGSELDLITGSGRPGSSNGSSTASMSKPCAVGSAVRTIPRPPSSGSGSSGSSSGRPGLRTPTAPVLSGVAAAAAAISNAMASAAVPKTVSTRPGAQRTHAPGAKPLHQGGLKQDVQITRIPSAGGVQGGGCHNQQQLQVQPLKQHQELMQAQSLQGVKTDDAMRRSFDTEQAKAAADAWFAQKARGSVSILDTAESKAVATVNAASRGNCTSAATGGGGGGDDDTNGSGTGKDAAAGVAEQGQQQQGRAEEPRGPAGGTNTDAAEGAGAGAPAGAVNLTREASSGSSNMSSLGPSISEVWQAANERNEANPPDAAAAGKASEVAAADDAQSAAAAVRRSQQQIGLEHARAARLPPQGPSTGRPGRQSSAAAATGAAGGSRIGGGSSGGNSSASTAAAGPGTRLSVRSSGGSASNSSGMWGSGSSTHTKQVSRPTGPITGRPVVQPSGPLTAALHSSAARRRANSANNACISSSATRDSTGSLTKGSPVRCSSANGQRSTSSQGRGWGCDGGSNSWGGAGTNSRSGSSCSYRSGGSSGYSSSNTGSSCAQAGAGQTAMEGLRAHAGALLGTCSARGRVGRMATGTGSNTSSPASDGVLFGFGSSSAANSPAGKGAPCQHSFPAGADRQLPAAAADAVAGVAGAPKAVRSLDWSNPVQGSQRVGVDTAFGSAMGGAGQATKHAQQQQQQQGRHSVGAAQLPPRPPLAPYFAANQQPVLQCVLAGRVQTGLLSPIVEEVSCNTTPRTSASEPTEGVRHVSRGAFSSSGTCRSSSKLSDGNCAGARLCISDDGTPNARGCVQRPSNIQPGAGQALPQSMPGNGQSAATSGLLRQQPQALDEGDARAVDAPDALKQAGRGGSPKPLRAGSISPPDTAVGKDTAPPGGSNSSSPWRKQGAAQREKQQWQQQQQEQGCGQSGLLSRTAGMADALQEIQPEEVQVTHTIMQGGALMVSQGGNVSNPQSLAAFPLDMGLVSHSLDSLDTVLIDTTSCCQSDEDHCADLAVGMAGNVRRAGNTEGNSGDMRAALPAAENGVGSVDDCVKVGDAVLCGPVRAAGCMLDLQDLLSIVIDVMNDKQAADKRYIASGLAQPTLGRHLQCYVAAKVHSNQAAYSSAMSAILTGLEQHKQVQPEIAVFCRVLSDELDEDYFHHRHLRLRQQLQHLATQAALYSTPSQAQQQGQQQQQVSDLWEDCCSMPLNEARLQGLLRVWAVERARVLSLQQGQQLDVLSLAASWELDIRQHCGCGPREAVRAGSAVAALLLWELDQQLQHLKPIADAFRIADVSCRGVLGLESFKVFCRRLNQAMSDEEIQVLFYQDMRAQQHEQVTFTAICRALLPAM